MTSTLTKQSITDFTCTMYRHCTVCIAVQLSIRSDLCGMCLSGGRTSYCFKPSLSLETSIMHEQCKSL